MVWFLLLPKGALLFQPGKIGAISIAKFWLFLQRFSRFFPFPEKFRKRDIAAALLLSGLLWSVTSGEELEKVRSDLFGKKDLYVLLNPFISWWLILQNESRQFQLNKMAWQMGTEADRFCKISHGKFNVVKLKHKTWLPCAVPALQVNNSGYH